MCFFVVLTVMKSVRFCQVYLFIFAHYISFSSHAAVQHPVFIIIGCIYLHPHSHFFWVSGDLHTHSESVGSILCTLSFCQSLAFCSTDIWSRQAGQGLCCGRQVLGGGGPWRMIQPWEEFLVERAHLSVAGKWWCLSLSTLWNHTCPFDKHTFVTESVSNMGGWVANHSFHQGKRMHQTQTPLVPPCTCMDTLSLAGLFHSSHRRIPHQEKQRGMAHLLSLLDPLLLQ